MIKSKERIAEFGEVFTSDREVKAMLELVAEETIRIDSRFLEPACGDGNFLIEILEKKLRVISSKYSINQLDYERNAFTAISSLYGIDLLEDNVLNCRKRLLSYFKEKYENLFVKSLNLKLYDSLEHVLKKDIIHGDALTLLTVNTKEAIVFSEWNFAIGSKVRQVEYTFNNLIAYQPFESDSLFSDLGEEAFLPKPFKSHSLKHFMQLSDDII